MSSMRRVTLLTPLLLMTAAAVPAQTVAPVPVAASAVSTASVNNALATWRALRSGGNYPFATYAYLLNNFPGWPGESVLRLRAERAMRPGEAPASVLAFFREEKPVTGNGHARLAEALAATGRTAESLASIRDAWASSDLPDSDEAAIAGRYWAHLTAADHDRRVDALLFDKQPNAAARYWNATTPARRAAFSARIALQRKSPDAETLYQAVMGTVTSDAGLMMDRARYLRDSNYEHAARQLFARDHRFTYKPADADRFFEMMLLLAEGAAEDRQYALAFNIARQADDALPTDTVLATQPLGIRDKYTSLAWLGGTAAWSGLGRAADGAAMFERYARGGRSIQVTTKGLYWAGRASIAAGRLPEASNYFQRASVYPEMFYGQLALERLGRNVPAPGPLPTFAVTPQQRSTFHARPIVQATRLLGNQGRYSEQSLFVRALSESLGNDADRVLATEFGQQIGRPDMAVWVARSARLNGSAFYVRNAFPGLPAVSARDRVWSLAHGIARQESSFDRAAVSHAGALGMMQLMPGTAREQAGKMGLGYDYSRLTSDPSYNVMLGTAYFQRLLAMWDGNAPLAIASYNAGAGNVRKWVNRYGDPRRGKDVLQWIEQIPFSETKAYVQRVVENSVVYDQMNPATPTTAVHVSGFLGKHPPG